MLIRTTPRRSTLSHLLFLSSTTPLLLSLPLRPPTMSNNPTAIHHYKLLLNSIKFQLANIPPNGATVAVMNVWGVWIRPNLGKSLVFRPSFIDNSVPISQNEFEHDPHYVVSTETSAWYTTASVQLDAYLSIPWLSWGKSFLPNTTEWRRREQQAVKRDI